MSEHELVDNMIRTTDRGIVARCTCGWLSVHFSSMAASVAFNDHKEKCAKLIDKNPQ